MSLCDSTEITYILTVIDCWVRMSRAIQSQENGITKTMENLQTDRGILQLGCAETLQKAQH